MTKTNDCIWWIWWFVWRFVRLFGPDVEYQLGMEHWMGVFTCGGLVYDVATLVLECSSPVEDIDVSLFEWILSEQVWDDDEGIPVAPIDVISFPDVFPEHADRIAHVNTSVPLLYTIIGCRFVIVDGYHRFAKQMTQEQPPEVVQARLVKL